MKRVECPYCGKDLAVNWIARHIESEHPDDSYTWELGRIVQDVPDKEKIVVAAMSNKRLFRETIEATLGLHNEETNEGIRQFYLLQHELRRRLADWLNEGER